MIKREEAKELYYSIEERETEYSVVVDNSDKVTDAIYNSVGSCIECQFYIKIFEDTNLEYRICEKFKLDEGPGFYCKKFERRINNG